MKINILQMFSGAKQAKGLTVIIDVFRAFSTACYAVANGAKKIIPVPKVTEAYKLKELNSNFILMGEEAGIMPEGFNYGNSPTEIEHTNFTGKTIVLRTSSGTNGIAHATKADEIITGSFVNAQAIVNYIKKNNPKEVSLVAIGPGGVSPCDEDDLCAQYIKDALENKETNFQSIVNHLRTNKEVQQFFFDPKETWAPERDFDLCLDLNKFNFVLKVVDDHLEKINI